MTASAPQVQVIQHTEEELRARRADLQHRLDIVEDPANSPWALRGEIDGIDFLLGE